MKWEIVAAILTVFGLVLIYCFPLYSDVKKCEGIVYYKGPVLKVFLSKKGNRIAVLEGALAKVPEWVEKGDNIELWGRGSRYKNTCFIFPEEIRYA